MTVIATVAPLPSNPLHRNRDAPINFLNVAKNLLQNSHLQAEGLHARLLKAGFLSFTSICNTLVHRYSDSGQISHARQVFDEIPQRNHVSWTSLISGNSRLGNSEDALETFLRMLDHGFHPNQFAFGSVLRSCSVSGYLEFGEQLHGLIMKMGFFCNVFVNSGLISTYSRNGRFDTALEILERMEKDVFSWTVMIIGFSNGRKPFEAITTFARMLKEGMMASEFALTSFFKACAYMEGLREGSQAHCYAIKTGLEDVMSVRASLIDFYVKSGDIHNARLIYDRSSPYDVVMCTAMIGAYAHNGNTKQAIEMLHEMIREFDISPNEFTFASLISSAAENGDVGLGTILHAFALKAGYSAITHVEGALIDMYAKGGNIEDAFTVFNNMETKDNVSCSSLLSGLSSNGYDQEALEFFSDLHNSSVKPDPFAVASAMTSCAKLSDQLVGKQIHSQIIKSGLESDTCIASSMIDMYAKSGTIEDAQSVFENLSAKDRIAWTAIIDGYAQHGQGRKALELFGEMIEAGINPNEVTFVSVLNACSHSQLIEEGIWLFGLMKSEYRIEPLIEHYACVVDLLGRAGRLEEGLEFINAMPMQPTTLIWRLFLGACRNHNNLNLGIQASKFLLELDPEDDAAYVLLANIYAFNDQWGNALETRNIMKLRNVRKVPGLSWVLVQNSYHVFGAGDTCHPQKELIYKKLYEVMSNVKKAGYVPVTEFALHDVNESEKERLLVHHSEKLAVAFGLIGSVEGSPIRVFKNLRICGDCHAAIKLISLVYRRTIIVRDVSRFHHFSEGACSCGEYW
ncbi:Pentatricopeptide repeat-containing protein [Apostasia shenzhenica]|uniref:Pentatricopeptide repeat-containing protein n=1 Tax=Apostasia shenzhenica TaxID=1088818 RepID=A0A2I0A1C6_9ASPA|nr:Pentatricopeptide repeat-containing protein [Apostasia shenzhenica]